jgi:SH3 domain protein
MNSIKGLFLGLSLCLSFFSMAQEAPQNLEKGYISDQLFIYMHSGAGNNYRILGTINAGLEVQLTGKKENGYSQILDTKGREAWVENNFVSTKPGLRHVIAELNGRLANTTDNSDKAQNQLLAANNKIDNLSNEKKSLSDKINILSAELKETKGQLINQDANLTKEWFFNGAIVLFAGLILGLIIPKIGTGRRRENMDNWK